MLLLEEETRTYDTDLEIALRKHKSGVVDVELRNLSGNALETRPIPVLRFYPTGRIQRLKTTADIDLFPQDYDGKVEIE